MTSKTGLQFTVRAKHFRGGTFHPAPEPRLIPL